MQHALRVLEWDQVRQLLAGHCESALGEQLAGDLLPSFHAPEVKSLQALLQECDRLSDSGLPSLKGLHPVGDEVNLCSKGAVLEGSQLAKIGQSLRAMDGVRKVILGSNLEQPILRSKADYLPELNRLGARLAESLDGDGYVLDSASQALATARSNKAKANKRILERIQAYTSGSTREYLSDTVYTQRNGRYVIPLKSEHKGKIRGIVHDTSASGQTIFVEPEPVVELGNQLRAAEAAEIAEVKRILKELSAEVGQHSQEIRLGLDTAAELDLVFAKVRYGHLIDGCVAELSEESGIQISSGRHPLLSKEIAVPLSLKLGMGSPSILITGPNTGGKTIAIKTVGLFATMIQSGMMVPALSVKFGCFSQLWADIGDEQSLEQSLSTFSGHIKNISEALKGLRKDALVLLDEIGAGTDPGEGAALASALIEEFLSGGAILMASTHYGELKLLASNHPQLANASMEFDLKSLRPTYRFLEGTPGSSHALKIASRYGVPPTVLASAEKGFSEQEKDISQMIEQLENAQRRAQKAQSEADRLSARLRKVEEEAERKIEQAEAARRRVGERASNELDELLRQIRIEAESVFTQVKQGGTQKDIDEARNKLRSLQEAGSGLSREVRPVEKQVETGVQIKVGTKVKVKNLNMIGIVTECSKPTKITIQAGAMKMDVDRAQVVALEAPAPVVTKRASGAAGMTKTKLSKAQSIKSELHLRQMRAEEAEATLDKFVDDALTAGLDFIRIVHGKGEGILRKMTHDFLRRHSQVVSFNDADAEEGGQGATIARLK
ncbi:MAG: endonuclease MutS2 [Fimbriimonadaceae bacterium]|nr:endonuclease MutS2 [Fimbriimonadaceae bacterium]